jgi:hypothetical protein
MWQPTQTQGQEIIARYNNGESLIDLETDTGISRWMLTKFLCERGIEIRNSAQAVRISKFAPSALALRTSTERSLKWRQKSAH